MTGIFPPGQLFTWGGGGRGVERKGKVLGSPHPCHRGHSKDSTEDAAVTTTWSLGTLSAVLPKERKELKYWQGC